LKVKTPSEMAGFLFAYIDGQECPDRTNDNDREDSVAPNLKNV
jgi:hypothetical protein